MGAAHRQGLSEPCLCLQGTQTIASGARPSAGGGQAEVKDISFDPKEGEQELGREVPNLSRYAHLHSYETRHYNRPLGSRRGNTRMLNGCDN